MMEVYGSGAMFGRELDAMQMASKIWTCADL